MISCVGDNQTKTGLVIAGNRHILYHALSALKHFNVPVNRTILLVTSVTPNHKKMVLEAAGMLTWAEIFIANDIFPKVENRLLNYFFLILKNTFLLNLMSVRRSRKFLYKTIPKGKRVDIIVSGFYGHPIDRTACSIIEHNLFVLVDDGNMTREVARKRKEEEAVSFHRTLEYNSSYEFSGLKGKIKLLMYRWFGGVQDSGSRNIYFFTHHHNLSIGKNDFLVPHHPIGVALEIALGTVHFLGIPAIEKNIVSPEDFCKLLKWIGERYSEFDLHYYCHPAEGSRENTLVKRVIPNASLHKNVNPYEQVFADFEKLPEIVSGFYSSALTNITAFNNNKIKIESLKIPLSIIISPSRRQRVKKIYEEISHNEKINIVNL